jgi:hypothetical protein
MIEFRLVKTGLIALASLLVAASSMPGQAVGAAVPRQTGLETLLDVLVQANFNGDFNAAGEALKKLVAFEVANGIEPSGRLAVAQVNETVFFVEKLGAAVQAWIDAGFPVAAAVLFEKYADTLRFEPTGAFKAKALAAHINQAGAALCAGLTGEAANLRRYGKVTSGICRRFGVAADSVAVTDGRPTGIDGLQIGSTIAGITDVSKLAESIRASLINSGLLKPGPDLLLSGKLTGNIVVSRTSKPGTTPFEYGIQIPYSEMEEYCDWKETSSIETVVESGVEKRVRRTTRTCDPKVRPVDRVRVEKQVKQVAGTNWTQAAIWQINAEFQDGGGCVLSRTFDGRNVLTDFEHNVSDPEIGLVPDSVNLPPQNTIPEAVGADIGNWLVTAWNQCLTAVWCREDSRKNALEAALLCSALPGADSTRGDRLFIEKFGLPMMDVLVFAGVIQADQR